MLSHRLLGRFLHENGGIILRNLNLKYGCNPHQKPARIYMEDRELPIKILNGNQDTSICWMPLIPGSW